ncbi:type IV toxin-antitoxin system AbiEi family antitoxin domain-containing protein [Aeromicrobium alkaliterrae]|uniref:AbiEi antitoxin N-terminal domain-containing protein n=1 Tax=Aeromicrobium alkaliterrae TaxID=302168 RepID=A0ABP4W4Y7_9ACTN
MHPDLDHLVRDRGFITRPDVLARGIDDRVLSHAVRDGTLLRIGVGLYAGPEFARLRPEEQHALRCHAIATRFDGAVAFSHQSAAILHGAATWGVDLAHVHVTRLDDGRGRHQAGVAHHVARLDDSDVIEVDGLLVTTPARTAWDVAVRETTESGLVIVDSLQHLGLTDEDQLLREARSHSDWRRARHAKLALTLSDERAESAGESRARYLMWEFKLPRPQLQVEVRDEDGELVGKSDFGWWEYRHLAEFDGMLKYQTGRDLAHEKVREDGVRRLMWGMSRMIWGDLEGGRRRGTAVGLLAAMEQSRRLYGGRAA